VQALRTVPASKKGETACRRGIDYLVTFVRSDGIVQAGPYGFSYPVYTAAGALTLFSAQEGSRTATPRAAWLGYLRQRQLTEELGWQPTDKEYGGWGYSPTLPRKPLAGLLTPPLTESNLSATCAALEALRAGGVSAEDPLVRKARRFIERCQNFGSDPSFDDGGFFFIYDDGVRNKAGVAGKDEQDRERYASYGSTTADGLRALLLCGLPPEHPRVIAARRWLETHFSSKIHPGHYAREREPQRRWAEAFAEQLLKRQRDDGSWVNPVVMVREDDPLVATSLAVRALAICRSHLKGASNLT
jgi:hypothetical protein